MLLAMSNAFESLIYKHSTDMFRVNEAPSSWVYTTQFQNPPECASQFHLMRSPIPLAMIRMMHYINSVLAHHSLLATQDLIA